MQKIRFHYLIPVRLPQRNNLKLFLIDKLVEAGNQQFCIDIIFVTDKHLLHINKTHLNHDYYTDIITFNLSENPNILVSEIYISIERVRDNAKQFNQFIQHELHRVVFHGILHLLGYNDKDRHQKMAMTEMENRWISEYF